MATAARDDNLQCGLCLNRYKTPKMLPLCHHTFCQGCIEGLVQNADGNPVRCPACRNKFKLPPGGVAALKTNFYIIPQLNHGLCKIHAAKPLEYFCQPCDVPLCLVCKLTDHEGHKTKALDDVVKQAREDLLCHQTRFEEMENTLTKQLGDVQRKIKRSDERREKLRLQVGDRKELLLEKFKAMLADCETEVLHDLDASFKGLIVRLQESTIRMDENLSTVHGLKQEVATALDDSNSTSLLTLTRDMSSGRGSQQQLQQLMSQTPDNNDQPILQWTEDVLPRDAIKNFLGKVVMFQPTAMTQSVKVQEVLHGSQDEELYVHAINFPGISSNAKRNCRLEKYRSNTRKTDDGSVCLGGLNYGSARVEFKAKDWLCDNYRTVCELNVKNPVSKDNKILAVLDDYKDVKIFHGNSQPHAIYSNQGQSFKPLDICFFTIGGEERLVIADWLNDVLHVVDFSNGCKLIGHLGVGCSELVKPTALSRNPAEDKELWIGCHGGHILKLQLDADTTFSSDAAEEV